MHYKDLDNVRRGLYGFNNASRKNFEGWISSIFEPYTVHPSLNVLRPETKELLSKKGWLGKLTPIFSKHLKISNLVKELLGIDLLGNREKGPSFIEEIAEILQKEQESKKTLNDRLIDIERELRKTRRMFAGLANPIHAKEDLPTIEQKDSDLTGVLVSLEGIVSHIDAIAEFDPGMAESFEDIKVSWIITDVPYFAMADKSKHHSGTAVGILIDEEVEDLFAQGIPFINSTGWFPYVIVFGTFREALTVSRPRKAIELAWLKYRKPKYPDTTLGRMFLKFYNVDKDPSYFSRPFINRNSQTDLLSMLSVILLCLVGNNVSLSNSPKELQTLVKTCLDDLQGQLPTVLEDAFVTK